MVKWTEEQIKNVADLMRKGLSLRAIFEIVKQPKSDIYGFNFLEVNQRSELFSIDKKKSITNLQCKHHDETEKRFSVKTIGNNVQITRTR